MKRKKKNTSIGKDTLTKYYKATYTNGDEAVFIGKDMNSATLYAMDGNSYGRTLDSVKEYDDMFKALTDY